MVINADMPSANTMESHIPSNSQINGNNNTNPTCNTNVLIKEMSAEITPLLSAVKKQELNIENPTTKNEKE